MARIYASKCNEISDREKRNISRARKIATEGMVLLENHGVLPINADGRVLALFGSGARRTVKGGTGSGDVNSREVFSVEQGLKEAGFIIGTTSWLDAYDNACNEALQTYSANFQSIIAEQGMDGILEALKNPYRDPDVAEITESDMEGTDSSLAIYVIARTSGEGSDRKATPGDYELSEGEKDNINTLTSHYDNTIVVLNVGGVIDTKFLRNKSRIGAILLMSQAGNVSGLALADVLTGKASPNGHLTTTWAENYMDYPCADTFSYQNGDLADEYYREGIYVGYRYFDSMGIDPAYPFGFGKSYTEFKLETESVSLEREEIVVNVKVTNVGSVFSGKESVQVYVSQPQGQMDKPYQVLAGFAKTKELAPSQSDTVSVSFEIRNLASYSEKEAAYMLEEGNYYVRVGNHSRNTHIVAALSLSETVKTEQLNNQIALDCEIESLEVTGKNFITYGSETEEMAQAPVIVIDPKDIVCKEAHYASEPTELVTGEKDIITVSQVIEGKRTLDELVAQLSVEELAEVVVGSARGGFGSGSTIGAASTACPGAAGDTTSSLLESRGIKNLVLADGPAGLRLSKSFVADKDDNIIPGLGESALGGIEQLLGMPTPERPEGAVDYYQYCTAIPIATMLAQTWDMNVLEEAGDIVGEEMEEYGVTLWLAPGMNIHRNPLCGRNFEYYSEDPLLAGACAAADTRGVQKHKGCGTTIKHFALNNQEDNRSHCNSHASERAIREIYLKGFEIAVKLSQPLALMTSYNLLNGLHTANHKELLTGILRDEWGFEGIVMTDWGTTGGGDMNPAMDPKYGFSDPALCIMAGNDLIMPGSQEDLDAVIAAVGKNITKAELQACAKRIIKLVIEVG